MIFLSAGITFLVYSSICTPRIIFQCKEMVKLIVLQLAIKAARNAFVTRLIDQIMHYYGGPLKLIVMKG